jgi:hypothetical protein
MQMEAEEDAQLFKPTGILKPPSISSVYDNNAASDTTNTNS